MWRTKRASRMRGSDGLILISGSATTPTIFDRSVSSAVQGGRGVVGFLSSDVAIYNYNHFIFYIKLL